MEVDDAGLRTLLADGSALTGHALEDTCDRDRIDDSLGEEVVAIQGTPADSRSTLIGIVAAYLPYQDVAFSLQTKRPRVIFEENSGLAVVFPVEAIVSVVALAGATLQNQPALTTQAAASQ